MTADRYILRCELKTAALFDAACRLGALFAGGRNGGMPPTVAFLGAFGAHIGVAFQILDDVLDVSGPAERTGKHRGTDLLDGTITLPLILARERDPELRSLDLQNAVTTPTEASDVCDRIAETGALEDSRDEALRYVGARPRLRWPRSRSARAPAPWRWRSWRTASSRNATPRSPRVGSRRPSGPR